MKKYEVSFVYASFDEGKDMYDGGPIEFTIEAECKEDAFEDAYVGALETDGVDQIVDMTIVCKETGEKYTLDDVEAYLDEKEEDRIKELKEKKERCYEKYKNSDKVLELKNIFEKTLKDFKNDVENIIKEFNVDLLIENFCVFIDEKHMIEKYDNAPTDNLKLHIVLQFCDSMYAQLSDEEYFESNIAIEIGTLMQYLEDKLTIKEYKYLKDKVADQIPLKMQYSKIIEILEKGKKVDFRKIGGVGREIFLI